mmetsp:Transcript_19846/g.45760  ORF Transcript_19846/g.45760 Transcript_19846/m.45760 type:complete len:334 (-) Transcript_19846:348-1349(-)
MIVRGALRPATVYECAYAATPRRRLARPPSLHAHRQESRFSFGFGFTALLLALANVCAPERLLIGLRGEAARIDGAGVPAAIAAPARAAISGARQKRTKMALKAKLSKVPVFMVTNEGGSPFLSNRGDGDQAALMFLFPADAEKMLQGVLKAPNGAASGARVLASNLDKAFKLAQQQPSYSGLRDQISGRELKMVWQFMPHAPEQMSAAALLVKTMKAPNVPKIPGYLTDSIVYSKRGKQVRPIFLAKKDLDLAIADAVATAPDQPKPQVIVVDLLDYLLGLLEGLSTDAAFEAEIDAVELVPPSESVSFREKLRSDKAPLKAKIVPPSPQYG